MNPAVGNSVGEFYDILIIDDNPDDFELCQRVLFKSKLLEGGFHLRYAEDGVHGLKEIKRKEPNCVLLDYLLPGNDGLKILQDVRSLFPNLPVVVLTGQGNERLAVSLIKSGAQDYLVKSEINSESLPGVIVGAIQSLSESRKEKVKDRQNIKILIVDDNEDDRELVRRALSKTENNLYHYREVPSGDDILNLIGRYKPSIVLLDYSLPGENGIQVLSNINSRFPFLPVIIVSSQGNEMIAAEAIKNGAFHYLVKAEISSELLDSIVNQGIEKKRLENVVHGKNQEIKHHQSLSMEQKKRFDRVVQATNIVVWEYDVLQDDFYVDKQIFSLINEEEGSEKLILDDLRKRIHKKDVSRFEENWRARSQGHEGLREIDYRVIQSDGRWCWIRETGSIVSRDSQGKPVKFAGLMEDVSEKKFEEQTLNEFHLISVDLELSFEEKVKKILGLGLCFLGLDTAVVSNLTNSECKVVFFESHKVKRCDSHISFSHSYCSQVFRSNEVVAFTQADGRGENKYPFYEGDVVNTYIGAAIYMNGKPYGTLSFVKKECRDRLFSEREKSLIRLFAQWISSELTRQKNFKDLEASESFLRLIQDSIPDSVFVKDEQFRIVRANPPFLNLYPESVRDSIIGTTTIESYSREDAERFLYQDKIALREGRSETEETILFPDGAVRTLHTKKMRFQDADMDTYILGVSHDITDIKRAELEKKELYEAMENAVEGISRIDLNGCYEYINDAYAAMCGYKADELLGKNWFMTIDNSEHEDMENAYRKMLKTGKMTQETRGTKKDGSMFYMRLTMISRYDDDGKFVGHHSFMNNISERKEAEALLRESEERYELAAKGASVGIWDWQDVNSNKQYWTPRFYELLGYQKGEIKADVNIFKSFIHPDDQKGTFKAMQKHFDKGAPFDVEYRLKLKSGEYRWFRGVGQVARDENERPMRMVGSIEDIHLRKVAEEKLIQTNLELERFAYVASHDLQEPLRMVSNFTQLLKKRYGEKLDDRAVEFIDFANDGAMRMQALVKNLLVYARVGNEAERYELIDLNEIKNAIEVNLLASIKQTNAVIEWCALPQVYADPTHIRSIFQNLIGNAIKYRKQECAPLIRVSVEPQEKYWLFSIRDNGIGMKPEYCQKIFEPFKRLHHKEEYYGTGMGLSICRKAIEGLGGSIWATSKLGDGSQFNFRLPKSKVDQHE